MYIYIYRHDHYYSYGTHHKKLTKLKSMKFHCGLL